MPIKFYMSFLQILDFDKIIDNICIFVKTYYIYYLESVK